MPAQWVDDHVRAIGGWWLAPPQLVAQLAQLAPPGPLVLVPRRQKRHVNSHLVFLGDVPEILLHPDDAAAAGVTDGTPVTVRATPGS